MNCKKLTFLKWNIHFGAEIVENVFAKMTIVWNTTVWKVSINERLIKGMETVIVNKQTFLVFISFRPHPRGEGPRVGPGHPQTDGRSERAMGAPERACGWLAQSSGASLGTTPGTAELHGPARSPADSGGGGQSYLAACRRPADRLSTGPHRQDHGESERQQCLTYHWHKDIKSGVTHPIPLCMKHWVIFYKPPLLCDLQDLI